MFPGDLAFVDVSDWAMRELPPRCKPPGASPTLHGAKEATTRNGILSTELVWKGADCP
jgi:hypothetical protein